ncbi:glycosyltransferase family 2 protein [Patescibacteria group bacterium]|nr:glycosyltransferase family 2 protein [Patescibacteria group bacterium]MBU1931564.1 glycosyltransferase family 2 protein [Patescibacteria group bacterium]
MISAIVLTKNEAENIKVCLKNLSWCDELIVIDNYSTDKTTVMAKQLGAKVWQHHLNQDFSQQRNFGLEKASHQWVFFVDADETVSPALKKEVLQLIKSESEIQGFYLKRQDFFLGKRLCFGETAAVKLLRLARKNAGQWQRPVHEIWQIKGRTGQLKNPLLHQRQLTVAQFLTRINNYSSIRAKELYNQSVKASWLTILAYPVGKFCQNYFFRLGLLDGQVGFMMALMMSIHSFLVRAKLYLLWQNQGEEEFKIPSMKEINRHDA